MIKKPYLFYNSILDTLYIQYPRGFVEYFHPEKKEFIKSAFSLYKSNKFIELGKKSMWFEFICEL